MPNKNGVFLFGILLGRDCFTLNFFWADYDYGYCCYQGVDQDVCVSCALCHCFWGKHGLNMSRFQPVIETF